jgi:hypothetical protein
MDDVLERVKVAITLRVMSLVLSDDRELCYLNFGLDVDRVEARHSESDGYYAMKMNLRADLKSSRRPS